MLTLVQLTTLQAAINGDQAALALWTAGNPGAVADYFNAPASPAFVVWRTQVTWDEIMENGMDFTRVDNLTNGSKWRIWEWLFKNSANSINPSKPNHRAGIDAAWVGTGQDLAVRAAVYVHCKRDAARIEKLFAVGVGTTADPATMTFEGEIPFDQVIAAMNLGV